MQTRPNLLRGTVQLACAGIFVKVIGACFKIPLGALLKPEGTAIFSVAYNLYAFLFVLATAGVPIAVSKLVAEAKANGRLEDAAAIKKTAKLLFGGVGLCGSIVLFFGADFLSRLLGTPCASAAIRAVSPSVFLVSLLSVNRGYFQGFGDMLPTAVSEIIEAAGKLVLGLSLAWWLAQKGYPASFQAAGAIFGVSLGCVLSAVWFRFVRRGVTVPLVRRASLGTCVKPLLSQVIPITLSASVVGLCNLIDSGVIMKTLQSVGMSEARSMWMFGTYTYASNLFNLPNTFVTALAVSLIPAVAGDRVRGTTADGNVAAALEVGLLIACTGAVGLGVLAKPILALLYGSGVEEAAVSLAAKLLAILCLGIPPLALTTVTNAIHQASGRASLPAVSMVLGCAVKVLSNCILLRNPSVRILGAAVSTVLCYTVIAGIGWALLPNRPSLAQILGKSVAVAFPTGAVAVFVRHLSVGVMNEKIATLLAVFCGAVCCFTLASLAEFSFFKKKYDEKSEKLE